MDSAFYVHDKIIENKTIVLCLWVVQVWMQVHLTKEKTKLSAILLPAFLNYIELLELWMQNCWKQTKPALGF